MKCRRFMAACMMAGSALLTGCEEAELIDALLSEAAYYDSPYGYEEEYTEPEYQYFDLLDLKSGKIRR